jgi:predicted anti-sigma-YlaC factor YlaD
MDCETFRNRLPAFAAGETDDESREAMQEHLKRCEACGMQAVGAAVPTVSDAEWEAMGRTMREQLASAPTPRARRARRYVRRWVELLGVAAAVLLAVGLLKGVHPGDSAPSAVQSLRVAEGWSPSLTMPRDSDNALVIWVTPTGGASGEESPDAASGGQVL